MYFKLNVACGGLISTHTQAKTHIHRWTDNLLKNIYILCIYINYLPLFCTRTIQRFMCTNIFNNYLFSFFFVYFVSLFALDPLYFLSRATQIFCEWFTRCQDASQTELSFRVNIFHACRKSFKQHRNERRRKIIVGCFFLLSVFSIVTVFFVVAFLSFVQKILITRRVRLIVRFYLSFEIRWKIIKNIYYI